MTSCWSVEDYVIAQLLHSLIWAACTGAGILALYVGRKKIRGVLEAFKSKGAAPSQPPADADEGDDFRQNVGQAIYDLETRIAALEIEGGGKVAADDMPAPILPGSRT